MSAAPWGLPDIGDAGSPAGGRPHLVLLPGGAAQELADGGGLRITRRGRVVLVALALVLVALVGGVGIRGAGAVEPTRTVTVAPGQTLSEVAEAELPELSISDGIVAIQLANRLSTAQVSAGQQLTIPRP